MRPLEVKELKKGDRIVVKVNEILDLNDMYPVSISDGIGGHSRINENGILYKIDNSITITQGQAKELIDLNIKVHDGTLFGVLQEINLNGTKDYPEWYDWLFGNCYHSINSERQVKFAAIWGNRLNTFVEKNPQYYIHVAIGNSGYLRANLKENPIAYTVGPKESTDYFKSVFTEDEISQMSSGLYFEIKNDMLEKVENNNE